MLFLQVHPYIIETNAKGYFMKGQNGKINILVLCSFYSSYVTQLCKYMIKFYPQIEYSLLTHKNAVEEYEADIEFIQNIYYYETTKTRLFYHQIDKLPLFDIIHSLWMEPVWGINARTLKKKARYWFNSVGGSDLYRFSSQYLTKILQKRIIRYSDWISSENDQTRDYFYKVYGEKYRTVEHSICRFGVDIIDYIKQFKQEGKIPKTISEGIPDNRISILCGTNASENHQHFAMIDAISRLNKEQRDKCHFIFPMTYPEGKESYISEVSAQISQVTDSFTILTKYMSVQEMAELAMITDVMLHVQTTDQLSSAMISHMYNGNIVIAGAWLPYDTLQNNHVFFLKVEKVSDLTLKMEEVISGFADFKEKCSKNADAIYQLSSWEMASAEWMKVYTSLMRGEN